MICGKKVRSHDMTNDEEILKNEVEGLLIDLVDIGYKVNVTYNELLKAWGSVTNTNTKSIISIEISNRDIKDIVEIKEYLNTLHDFMTIKDSKMVSIDVYTRYSSGKLEVELLEGPNMFSKIKGKKDLNFEKIWDSIDYAIFASNSEIGKFSKIIIKYF